MGAEPAGNVMVVAGTVTAPAPHIITQILQFILQMPSSVWLRSTVCGGHSLTNEVSGQDQRIVRPRGRGGTSEIGARGKAVTFAFSVRAVP